MSMMDPNSCHTFNEDVEFVKQFKNSIAFVPYIEDNKIFIFKVRIDKVEIAYNCFDHNDHRRYIHFSIECLEKQNLIKEFFLKIFTHSYDLSNIKTYWKNIHNFYHTSDFYSMYMPTGFLHEEIVFKTPEDALNYSLKNGSHKYFVYDCFVHEPDIKVFKTIEKQDEILSPTQK